MEDLINYLQVQAKQHKALADAIPQLQALSDIDTQTKEKQGLLDKVKAAYESAVFEFEKIKANVQVVAGSIADDITTAKAKAEDILNVARRDAEALITKAKSDIDTMITTAVSQRQAIDVAASNRKFDLDATNAAVDAANNRLVNIQRQIEAIKNL